MIPRIGCRVQVVDGKHKGKTGRVEFVVLYKDKLRGLDEHDARLFTRANRARYGDDWVSKWFEATIRIDDGSSTGTLNCSSIKILDETRVRGYRKQNSV